MAWHRTAGATELPPCCLPCSCTLCLSRSTDITGQSCIPGATPGATQQPDAPTTISPAVIAAAIGSAVALVLVCLACICWRRGCCCSPHADVEQGKQVPHSVLVRPPPRAADYHTTPQQPVYHTAPQQPVYHTAPQQPDYSWAASLASPHCSSQPSSPSPPQQGHKPMSVGEYVARMDRAGKKLVFVPTAAAKPHAATAASDNEQVRSQQQPGSTLQLAAGPPLVSPGMRSTNWQQLATMWRARSSAAPLACIRSH